MNIFVSLFSASFLAIFLQNAIFERGLGLNILLYASRKWENVIRFSVMIISILTLSSLLVYPINKYLGHLQNFRILMPIFYIIIISVIYVVSLILIWFLLPKIFLKIKSYVHLSVFNASVIGALFLENTLDLNLPSYIGYGFGTGVGFLLAGYFFAIAHQRLNSNLVPSAFRGVPVMLMYGGIISLALYAFVGY